MRNVNIKQILSGRRRPGWPDAVCAAAALAAVLLFFGPYMADLQQTDTYAKWYYSIAAYRGQYKVNARLGEWVYMEFFYRIMGEPQHYRAFHVAVGILLDTAIVYLLWRVVCDCCRLDRPSSRLCAILPVAMLRVNVFYSDIFQFGVDTAPMFIGDLLAIAAALAVTGTYVKRCFPTGAFLLAASLMFRQTCLFWFLFTGLFIAFCGSADGPAKLFVKECMRMAGAVLLAVLPTLLLINLWSPSGTRGSFTVIALTETWRAFREKLYLLIMYCDGAQPKGFYPFVAVGALLLNAPAWMAIRKERGVKTLFSVLAREAVVLLGVFAGTFFTLIFDIYLPHRSSFGFATFPPLLALFPACFGTYRSVPAGRILRPAAFVLLAADLAMNGIYAVRIREGMAETNRVDRENARFYYALILEHEERTGERIKKIAWHEDANYTRHLPGVPYGGNLNDRAYTFPWSRREILPFTVGRRFLIAPFDDDLYRELFGDSNWKAISEEQVRFIGDTAYIALY